MCKFQTVTGILPCRTLRPVPGKALKNQRAWLAPLSSLSEVAGCLIPQQRKAGQHAFGSTEEGNLVLLKLRKKRKGPLGQGLCLIQKSKNFFFFWRVWEGDRNAAVVRSVLKETGCWERKSNVTPGGKFLDHLLESA